MEKRFKQGFAVCNITKVENSDYTGFQVQCDKLSPLSEVKVSAVSMFIKAKKDKISCEINNCFENEIMITHGMDCKSK